MRRFKISYIFCTAITALILFTTITPVYSQDNNTITEHELFTDISTGYHFYNNSGYHGKVSEYLIPDSGFDATILLDGSRKNNYFSLSSEILDKDDQTHLLNLDLQRYLIMDLSYMKFRHFLDHDPLSNQDFFTDYNRGEDNGITIEEIKADNTIRIPALPFLKFFANIRKYKKEGTKQTTTVSKDCSSCHVSSVNKRVNQSTDDIILGFEGTLKKITFNYEYSGQRFYEDASAPRSDYGQGASFYQFSGINSYGDTPDFKKDAHKISLRSPLPFSSSIFASYQFGKRTNRDTHNDIDFSSFSARLYKYFSRFLSCDLFYGNYQMDSRLNGSFERDIEKGGIDIKIKFLKRTSAKITYRWEDIDRNNFSEDHTRKTIYKAALNTRIMRKLRLHIRYKKTRISEPFALVDNAFTESIIKTTLPKDENQIYASLNWNPYSAFSLNSSIRYTNSRNTEYNIDEDLYEFIISSWYMPFQRLTLMGSFTLFKNEIDTGSAYKPFHLRDEGSLIFYDNVPYDSLSHSIYLSATYIFSPRLALTGDITFINCSADFDNMLNNNNIGDYSDLDIDQMQASAGFTYLINPRMSLYGKYIYHEYEDQEESAFDGEYSLISFGLNYSF